MSVPPAPLPRMYAQDNSADHARRVLRRAENADRPGAATAGLLRAAFAHHITQIFGRQYHVDGRDAGFTLYEHAFLLLDGTETSLWEVEHTATPDGRHMCEVYDDEQIRPPGHGEPHPDLLTRPLPAARSAPPGSARQRGRLPDLVALGLPGGRVVLAAALQRAPGAGPAGRTSRRKITASTPATHPSDFWNASTNAAPIASGGSRSSITPKKTTETRPSPSAVAHLLHGVDQPGRRTGVLLRHLGEDRVGQRGHDQAHADAHDHQRERHLPGADVRPVPPGLPDVEQHARRPSAARRPAAPCGRSAAPASARRSRPPPETAIENGMPGRAGPQGAPAEPHLHVERPDQEEDAQGDSEGQLHGDAGREALHLEQRQLDQRRAVPRRLPASRTRRARRRPGCWPAIDR